MTDRELLEMAARAADIVGKFSRVHQPYGDMWVEGIDTGARFYWNPLVDDGDALRLASQLELDVLHRVVGGSRVEVLPAGGPLIQEFYERPADRLAATRRAIVLAATKARRAAPAHPGEEKEKS